MLVGTLVLMGVLDLVLLGTTMAAVTVVAILFLVLMPAIARAQKRAEEHVGRLGAVLEGSLRAIRTVKVSLAEGRQSDKIVEEARESARYSIRAVRRDRAAVRDRRRRPDPGDRRAPGRDRSSPGAGAQGRGGRHRARAGTARRDGRAILRAPDALYRDLVEALRIAQPAGHPVGDFPLPAPTP